MPRNRAGAATSGLPDAAGHGRMPFSANETRGSRTVGPTSAGASLMRRATSLVCSTMQIHCDGGYDTISTHLASEDLSVLRELVLSAVARA